MRNFIVFIAVISMIMSGCQKKCTWDDMLVYVDVLIEDGWYIYIENTEEIREEFTQDYNKMLKTELGITHEIEFLNILCLTNDSPSDICCFEEYSSKKDVNYIIELYASREGNKIRVYAINNFLISTNTEITDDILNIDFELAQDAK